MRQAGMLAAVVAALVVISGACSAAAVPNDYVLDMEMSFIGMTVGRARLSATTAPEGLTQQLSVETTGLAQRLTGFRSESNSLATESASGARTLTFDTRSESNRATREVQLRYDGDGRVVELATFKRGEQEVSEVPPDLRDGTVDPLVALNTIRQWLADARADAPQTASFEVFDGRRRYDLEVRLDARRDAQFAQGPTPILELEVVMKPIAGFNDDDDDERRLTVFVSDDDDLVPLILRTATSGGLQAALYTRRACTGDVTPTCREFVY